MQLNMNSEIFTSSESLPYILTLLRCVQDGKHVWVADENEATAAKAYMQEHVPSLADSYSSLAQKGTVQIQWIGATQKPAVITIRADNLGDAAHDLSRPAVVVVEDLTSDGSFLISLCAIFGADRITAAHSNGWLEIRHGGGGGSLPSVTRAEINLFRRHVRVAALLDSDRLVPGEHTDAYNRAEALQKLGATVHVLELREIENYVPNRALAAVRPQRTSSRRLKFLKRLTSDQRAVYDMKHGFGPASSPPVIPPRQVPVYGGLSQETLRGLRSGFGRNVASCMNGMTTTLTKRDFHGLGTSVVAEITTMLQNLARII